MSGLEISNSFELHFIYFYRFKLSSQQVCLICFPGQRKRRVPWVVLAVVLPTLAALNLVTFLCLRNRRRQIAHAKQQSTFLQNSPIHSVKHIQDSENKSLIQFILGTDPMYSTEAEDIEMVDSMMIDVSTLRTATGDFDESNKLGEGGFGAVYKVPDDSELN